MRSDLAEKTEMKAEAAGRSESAEYDALNALCPSRKLLDRISNKWVVLVLAVLSEKGEPESDKAVDRRKLLRYSELSRALTGVSQKMLTQTLRNLERDGLIDRIVTPSTPVSVSYALTDLGVSLSETIGGLRIWAETHMRSVLEHRRAVDSTAIR